MSSSDASPRDGSVQAGAPHDDAPHDGPPQADAALLRIELPPLPAREASYALEIQPGISARAGERLLAWGLSPGPLALISETRILELHGAPLLASLREAGFEPVVCRIPGGEESKSLAQATGLYPRLAAAGIERGSPVVAFGGGVVGDLAGFVAATWMRGVPFVQIPTTLLAMVDSSTGGKTGVDLPAGKNLVGAFKQPAGVLIDPALLTTLPPRDLRSGLAEVVKHGLIAAPALFERLTTSPADFSTGDQPGWSALIAEALAVKVALVSEDPYERGRRAHLNLGHTFGHAFELCSAYALPHGEGVAVGLVAAAALARELGEAPAALCEQVRSCLQGLGLPTTLEGIAPTKARLAMSQDKKKRGRRLRFVIPRGVGEVILVDDPGPPVDRALAEVLCR